MKKTENIDTDVVKSFGEEWSHFKNNRPIDIGTEKIWKTYFEIFPFDVLNSNSEGFDMGCGSGRWANFVAPMVGTLNCIDPSNEALNVAKENLSNYNNCFFECSGVNESKLKKGSQDFGYSLGVLHHIPDTKAGLKACASFLKPGAPFLLYLYYKFDDKPWWFKVIWKISEIIRYSVSRLPFAMKKVICNLIAFLVYLPLARISKLIERFSFDVKNIPLSAYRNQSFYVMLNDSLDRFGTKLEQRFSKEEILEMMQDAGFTDITFAKPDPGWICVGYYNPKCKNF